MTETVPQFRKRAAEWLAANMSPLNGEPQFADRADDATWQHARELQRRLFDGGFAGICYPREYGGLGLDYAYQLAFNEEAKDYAMPVVLNIPSLTICSPTMLDTASENQKRTHIAAALRGDEVLCQLLSEPSGGSDLAGVVTRAERRGDRWRLNGAKTWSSSAFAADFGLCLARTDWDVPKHDGLTMFLVPLDAPGLTLRRIRQVNGSAEFCEEFLDDVELSDAHVVGEVGGGWAVASRQLFHERRAVAKGSEYANCGAAESGRGGPIDLVALVAATKQSDDRWARRLAGRALAHRVVEKALGEHVFHGVSTGRMSPASGSMTRLFFAECENLVLDTALALVGEQGVVGTTAFTAIGEKFLSRQIVNIGGGTTEIARNIIAERVLEFPREHAADRGVPFKDVRRTRGGA
ncbi:MULTISPECIES: acyl-CoA dehydrogenase family protein [Mycobacterium avium complex (MAC)]|uniref:acyl-CoA dehydrogenase family protein n=1 Tax=Mycobacterium avium complex (MAC) TaxID=120793 RepID=UPI0019168991|nr:acyl-CoA dehydrogenase family protein [Mycobacterium paraintracellulare]BCP08111.1 acyl-CoA dehydrogenase [Mycobacterium paraintracellulare]